MKTRVLVRIPCRSRADAKELALRLQADDRSAVRRWQAVIVSTETRAEAERLALSLQSWVGPGSARIRVRRREGVPEYFTRAERAEPAVAGARPTRR